MTTKQLVLLEKRLVSTLAGFAVRGRLVCLTPLEHTLRGFAFEGSDFDRKSFYVNAFFLPLCVPREHLILSFGKRLRHSGADRWSFDDADIENQLRITMANEATFLRSLQSPAALIRALRLHASHTRDPYAYESVAYLLAREGNTDSAIQELDHLITMLDPAVEWQSKMAVRANFLMTKLLVNPQEAAKQIRAWELKSCDDLGLHCFRASEL